MDLVVPDDFDKDKTYYISGPMTGYPEHNYPTFRTAVQLCEENDIIVMSPHLVKPAVVEPEWRDYLAAELMILADECAGILMLEGWPQSKGAFLELTVAIGLGFPVYFFDVQNLEIICMNKKAPADAV